MIVLDTSVLVAILRGEPDADDFLARIVDTDRCLLSSVSLLETSMVLAGRSASPDAWTGLDQLIEAAGVEIVPFSAEQAALAREAFICFGKGRHPAGLNFGDCASYALAKAHNLPLLFKGNDFPQTDIATLT
ncbi:MULTISPECIES: type II toxin-antitoxin system VapC family toxin [Acetobacteraceae]|uniref:Ribonuclease VapC n=2 Tax=Acetobacteraceae TaxID=433 RepID=A0A318R2P1_9PROT|nr:MULTISPECIES: type II toxin-antitoxin system VapC family toxin [Acetobacteraceae]GBR38157.1 PilT domain-containing protein [Komagataeibacter oboediens DSM 11826]MCW4579250.1 type II toxin-antitoxin system VapC family toxin [Gluconacetobacter entanii]MCW4582639.1 type II toxin-antitoxin system VapC family toxin [Gluconacetobacter entanii]MCW4586034.1 type II toxin-antitoxin system VapC family toxin [Gluconacetobacter entanii]PYD74538.1 PIN domain nuclease [Novacetimonas pomaceti]